MDLNGYKLVFEDDFNGEGLDYEKWGHRGVGSDGIGFNSPEMTRVENGNLIIGYGYLENGQFGPGWYADNVYIKEKFLRGYFECRAICGDPVDRESFWSAFWIQGTHPYEPALSKGGPGSAEIDIIEGFLTWDEHLPAVEHNVHCAGYPDGSGEGLRSMGAKSIEVPTCYTEYHTYGLEWTEDVYRFYVDGECTLETAWADGVSEVAETVVFSNCHPGKEIADKNRKGEFIVDYVRVYQKED